MDIHTFGSAPSSRRSVSRSLCSALALVTALTTASLTGCGFGAADTSTTPVALTAITGKVHGGVQPISGSTVQVWAVGNSGYGSAATKVGSSTTTGSDGSFTLNAYANCPSASTLVYITATGGNPGLTSGTNNAAIHMVSALGQCGNLTANTFIWVNEVTTAAAAFSLGQYVTTTFGSSSTDSIGAPNTAQAQLAIANAFATNAMLVSSSAGQANSSSTITGTGTASAASVTVTPEATKLNSIADILSACVNSDGSGTSACATLFPDVAPNGGTTPTDIFQAAVDLSLNPTSNNANGSANNMTALYGLISATPPYTGLTAQPTDWTVGIQYKDANGTAGTLFPTLQNIAVDSAGNVWATNLTTTNSGLVEISPTGTPQAIIPTIGGQTLASSGVRNLAIDLNNNAWVTSTTSSGYVYEYGNGGSTSGAFPTSKSGYGLAIDKNNNVFVLDESSSVHVQIVEFPAGTALTSTSSYTTTNNIDFPDIGTTPGTTSPNGSTAFQPEYGAFDTSGNLWMAPGSSASGSYNYLVELSNIDTSQCTTFLPCYGAQDIAATPASPWVSPAADPGFVSSTSSNTYTFTPANLGGANESNSIVAAQGGGVWVTNSIASGNSLDTISLINNLTTGTNFGGTSSLATPKFLAMDGSGNLWVVNKDASIAGGSIGGTVTEFSPTGAVLSPTSSNTATTNPGYVHAGLNAGTGIAIDPSGNVWVASSGNTSVFEIVGAATPVVTPIAAQLKSASYPGMP